MQERVESQRLREDSVERECWSTTPSLTVKEVEEHKDPRKGLSHKRKL